MFSFLSCFLWLTTAAPASPAISRLEKQCAAREAKACLALGQAQSSTDVRQALAAFDAGCRLGSASSCLKAGRLLDNADGLARDTAEVRRYFREACTAESATGCLLSARVERAEGGDARTPLARAIALARPACDGGDLDACAVYLYATEDTEPPPLSGEERATLAGRWCNRGANWACGRLALSFYSGEGVKRDGLEAARLGRLACDKGERLGCLAVALVALDGGRLDEALKPAQSACAANVPAACVIEGGLRLKGKGGAPRDSQAGWALIERGCQGGEPDACDMVRGEKTLDAGRREHATDVGCRLGSAECCRAVLRRAPAPTGQTLAAALQVVCKATPPDLAACTSLGELQVKGEGLPKDEAAGVALLERVCLTPATPEATRACQALVPVAPAPLRWRALTVLCRPLERGSHDWCTQLVRELDGAPAAQRATAFPAYSVACGRGDAKACTEVERQSETVSEDEGSLGFRAVSEGCRESGFLEACRAARVLGRRLGRDVRFIAQAECAAGQGAPCLEVAGDGTDEEAVWALDGACRAGLRKGCVRLDELALPDIAALKAGFARDALSKQSVADTLRGALLAFLLTHPPSQPGLPRRDDHAALDRWRASRAADARRWFESLPRRDTLRLVRDAAACHSLVKAGLPADALQLEMSVSVRLAPGSFTFVFSDDTAGGSFDVEDGTARLPVCADRWGEQTQVFGMPGPVQYRGALVPNDDFSRFEPLRDGAEASESPAPAAFRSRYGLAVEFALPVPTGGSTVTLSNGVALIRAAYLAQKTLDPSIRISLSFPAGGNTPFAVQAGLGTVLGTMDQASFRWRLLTAFVDAWFTLDTFRFALVPGVGTQLALSLGGAELDLEVGLRLPIAVAWDDGVGPPPLQPMPFAALGLGF